MLLFTPHLAALLLQAAPPPVIDIADLRTTVPGAVHGAAGGARAGSRSGEEPVLGPALRTGATWMERHRTGLLVLGGFGALLLGGALGTALQRALDRAGGLRNKPRWPRDWPTEREIFTRDPDPTKPGYMALSPQQAMGSGAMPLGRTYPKLRIFPDKYPFREWRRRVEFWTSRPVWVPYAKRFQHFFVLGATGKGKSTAYAVPILAWGALERERFDDNGGVLFPGTAYFAVDVKSPAFVRMFARLYRQAGKETFFIDPWSPTETLAFEPLWKSGEERKKILSDVIATYSLEPGQLSGSENSEFFKIAAVRLLNGLIDLAQYWPRRYCNLPCLQQLVGAGGDALKEAFEKSGELHPPLPMLVAALEQVLAASAEELRGRPRPRRDAATNRLLDDPKAAQFTLDNAVGVVDRAGYRLAFMVKRMRQMQADTEAGKMAPERLEEVRQAFWAQVKHEWIERKQALDSLILAQGEFIQMPPETRNSVVSTLTNKINWFRDQNIGAAFSRDEIDVRSLIERPCLFLVGAPMAKLKVGSLFVSALLTNMALNAVFQRGMAIEKKEKVSKHGIFFMLDEFPQLAIKEAPAILATFRGFMSGLMMIFQERGQLKQLYSENATTMESNTVHKVLLQGSHEETAKFYAEMAIGDAVIKQESSSGVAGEKKNISVQYQKVPLMDTIDVRDMRLNGKPQQGMALSVGTATPAFPMRPVPFFDDPMMRKLLGLRRTVSKKGFEGRKTWRFWEWGERWEPASEGSEYLVRRKMRTPEERAAGTPDPVWERRQDPYTQYLDYLLGDAKGVYDELEVPQLVLGDINVIENDPRRAAREAAERGMAPAAGGPALAAPAAVAPMLVAPVYATDCRFLIARDFQPLDAILERPAVGGGLAERAAAALSADVADDDGRIASYLQGGGASEYDDEDDLFDDEELEEDAL